jgi:hypothetical protein
MLQELQKTHKQFRNIEALVLDLIRKEFGMKSGKQKSIKRVIADPLILLEVGGVGGGYSSVVRKDHHPL